MGAASVEIGSAPSIARHLAFVIPAGDRERVWPLFARARSTPGRHGMVRDGPRCPRQRLAVNPAGSISPFLCFELFQSTGDPGGAEVAGMTIPEHGHIRIPVQTAPM